MKRVVVRVYDSAGLDHETKTAALATARAAFATASIDVVWKSCPPAARVSPCAAPPTGELMVRLVRPSADRSDRLVALGDAFVDTGTRSAVLATIYVNSVFRFAGATGMATHSLLGYAIAHELGHLLLGSNIHSAHGLMRAIWREDELRRGEKADWSFTPQDIAGIRERLGLLRRLVDASDTLLW